MDPEYIDNPLYCSWPFWVLELPPTSKTLDIEKSAREIAAKIEFGAPGADQYATPVGVKKRDEFLVREAKFKLQDPKARLLAEFWYLDPKLNDKSSSDNANISVESWCRDLGVQLWEA